MLNPKRMYITAEVESEYNTYDCDSYFIVPWQTVLALDDLSSTVLDITPISY